MCLFFFFGEVDRVSVITEAKERTHDAEKTEEWSCWEEKGRLVRKRSVVEVQLHRPHITTSPRNMPPRLFLRAFFTVFFP